MSLWLLMGDVHTKRESYLEEKDLLNRLKYETDFANDRVY